MDLSTGGNLDEMRKMVLKNSSIMVGTVPLYAVFAETVRDGGTIKDISANMLMNAVEKQAKEGVDFITVHCGINKQTFDNHDPSSRVAGIVSRGGSLTRKWMEETGNENPLFEYFDRLLEIARKYDVTISLGDGLRPGGLPDATDGLQLSELAELGRLVKKCRENKVQVMVEGPGHVPLQDIELNMQLQKKMCYNAPFYVLGPLVCDCAPGYDHITSAIGGAIAAWHGADFLCYVTPAEHLSLPDMEDVKQGVVATKIAAHAGDIAKNIPGAFEHNHSMSVARRNLDWEKMFALSIDEKTARERKNCSDSAENDHCSMCGSLCALKHQ
jgi:phosphomethylpyrimidine synthase